jgi:hypothetical protein
MAGLLYHWYDNLVNINVMSVDLPGGAGREPAARRTGEGQTSGSRHGTGSVHCRTNDEERLVPARVHAITLTVTDGSVA